MSVQGSSFQLARRHFPNAVKRDRGKDNEDGCCEKSRKSTFVACLHHCEASTISSGRCWQTIRKLRKSWKPLRTPHCSLSWRSIGTRLATAALPSAMRKAGWAKGIGNRVWGLRQVPPEFVDRVCETAHDLIQRLHNFTVSTSKRGLSEQQRSIAPSRKSPPLTEEPGVGQQLAARAAAVQARLRRQNLPALAHNRLEIVQLLPVLICA